MTTAHKYQLIVTAVITVVVCVGGAVLIVLGAGDYTETRAFMARAQSTHGRVYGFETYDAPGVDLSDDIHYAMVRFTLDDGREIRFRGPSRDGPVNLHKGDEVEVLYEPDNPQAARVANFMGLWFRSTMLAGFGAAAIVVPLLTLWQIWRWVKRQDAPQGG